MFEISDGVVIDVSGRRVHDHVDKHFAGVGRKSLNIHSREMSVVSAVGDDGNELFFGERVQAFPLKIGVHRK